MKISFLLFIGLFLPIFFALAEDLPLDEGDPLPESNIQKEDYARAEKKSKKILLEQSNPWYRDAGEYMATRTTRIGQPTEVNTSIVTDAKRYDVTLGKRIPLLVWNEKSLTDAWVLGLDGGMLASLSKYNRNGKLTFATNTFDGFFGAFIGRSTEGWNFLLRTAHLSAHQVDNSPQLASTISYSHFWNEIIVAKTFPHPDIISNWDLHIQGSVGFNNTSSPSSSQPRASGGMSLGYAISGPDSLALLASADVYRAGVLNQSPTYSYFMGFGTLNRPNTTHRPFRAGVIWFKGSDYRNQFYTQKQDWVTFQIATEF